MKPKILILDDETIILQSLATLFGSEGIAVDTECLPLRAIERVAAEHYGVVLVDIIMPQMTGVEVIRAVKSIDPLCNIIVMTAYSSMRYVVECIEAGAGDYLTKPFVDAEILLHTVRDALARVERWRQSFGINFGIAGRPAPCDVSGRADQIPGTTRTSD
jgi:DNA-binding NtrC family response regulator